MLIKSVEKFKGSTVCIEFEGHDNVYVNEKIAAEYCLRAGMNIPESAVEEIKADDLEMKAKDS